MHPLECNNFLTNKKSGKNVILQRVFGSYDYQGQNYDFYLMVKTKKTNPSAYLSEIIIHGMQEKKGNDIVRLDLRNIHSSVSDYFVVCHAESTTQVRALAQSVEEEVYKALNQEPWHKEGLEHAEWILLDFVDVVVHVFKTDKRHFYGIEDLWGDAEIAYYQIA